jgi:GNAT superfamily N-acetyltransferase
LRRALGDTSLGEVPAHITLVPPVNVRRDQLEVAVGVLRAAAASQPGRLHLSLGPPATFWPVSPVVYLRVGGDDVTVGRLARLHEDVLSGPLQRPERWPWAPHVTLADQASDDLVTWASVALERYQAEATVGSVVLMEERHRLWAPLADVAFGPGGLALEMTEGRYLGADLAALWGDVGMEAFGPVVRGRTGDQVVLSCLREGAPAGVAAAWVGPVPGAPVQVAVMVRPECRSQGVGRALLAVLRHVLERRGWDLRGAGAYGPPAFFERSTSWLRPLGQPGEPA